MCMLSPASLTHYPNIRQEHGLHWVLIYTHVFFPDCYCGAEDCLYCCLGVAIDYEDLLQVVQLHLFLVLITKDTEAYTDASESEDPNGVERKCCLQSALP